jgi:uncharacterized protein (TIGR03000 family)
LLAAAALCALPSVGSAQPPPYYSPYHYLRHGTYYDPYLYSAPGTSPGSYWGTAAYVYGDAYSPYDYLRHGTYAAPSHYGAYSRPAYYGYTRPELQAVPVNDPRAFIQVRVPAAAEIWFDGDKTSQSGAVRDFVSPALQTGRSFTYEIRARWTDDSGKVIDKTKQVKVEAGKQSTADFLSPDAGTKR